MKIATHLISKDWNLGINQSEQWLVVRPGYGFISNHVTPVDLHVVNAHAKALNKLDKLEDAIASEQFYLERRTPSANRFSVSVPVEKLRAMLDFCCNDDTRYYANGVYVTPGYLVASDAITLCKLDVTRQDAQAEGGVTLPRIMLHAFLKALDKNVKTVYIDVYPKDNFAVADAGDLHMETTCIAGQFPPWEQAMPKTITHDIQLSWSKETDLFLATADKNQALPLSELGHPEVEQTYNGPLLKKILKYSTTRMELEFNRPAMLKTEDRSMTFLIVPTRY